MPRSSRLRGRRWSAALRKRAASPTKVGRGRPTDCLSPSACSSPCRAARSAPSWLPLRSVP
eukprot:3155922-Alexandrium_andersonii.AAC.1